MKQAGYAIGLMSGTSLDGVDAVAISLSPPLRAVAHASMAMPAALKQQLLTLSSPHAPDTRPGLDLIDLLGIARRDLTDLYAATVARLPAAIVRESRVIGAHGQTIRHRPEHGFSLQIIDGARLAEASGLPVVTDFRSADLAAGGQGAPLAPIFHQLLPDQNDLCAAVVNIGGIANITVLGPANVNAEASGTAARAILAGFDTGPGNRLLDDWCELHRGEAFDRDGRWAAAGRCNRALLEHLQTDPFFARPAPKSTGREDFSLVWLQKQLEVFEQAQGPLKPADVQATLTELTASTIAAAAAAYEPGRLVVCGGGAANPVLMHRLGALMPHGAVSTAILGIDPQQVEAAAFAWLAQQRLADRALDLTGATGARGPRILGAVYPAPVS